MAAQLGACAALWWWPAAAELLRDHCAFSPAAARAAIAEFDVSGRRGSWLRIPVVLATQGFGPMLGQTLMSVGPVQAGFAAVFLLALGRRLEARSGSLVLLVLYLLGGVGAAVAEMWRWPESTALRAGSSAATCCIVAAYGVRYSKARIRMLVPVVVVPVVFELPCAVVLGAWLALQLEPIQRLADLEGWVPFSWAGLAGGLGVGILLGPLLLLRRAPVATDS